MTGRAGSPTRSLALFSVALVDVWKGVGLATVIYIAGLVSIPGEYYEAAEVDGASRWELFRNIMLPLARPATASVITLSLIGGLRSFDLIWSMTKGGPGFASDVIASVIYKQYQAGFYGLSTAGSVVLFLVGHDHRRAADLVAQPRRGDVDEEHAVAVVIGRAAIVLYRGLLRRSIPVHLPHRLQRPGESALLEFSWPKKFVLFDNIAAGIRGPRLPDGHRLHQQRDPHRGQRRRPGDPQRNGRLRLATPARSTRPGRSTSWSWPG